MEKVILLADRKSNAWNFAERIQKYLLERRDVEIPLQELSTEFFINKEINMEVPENVRKKDVYFIQDSTRNPQEWWVQLLLLKDLLLSASAESVSFVLPDMFYSRKDRKDMPHVPISARALARSISPGLKRIITMDLHAPQIQGFYPEDIPIDNLYSFPSVVNYLKENPQDIDDLEKLVALSPDAGGTERVRAFAQKLESQYPIAFIEKRRPHAGEIEEMNLIGNVRGRDVFIVDDMIDSGGTLCKAASLLKEKGAKKLFCYGTHGLFTEGTERLSECFERTITSNTHYPEEQDNRPVEVMDVSHVFAEAIYRAQKGLSISKLFE